MIHLYHAAFMCDSQTAYSLLVQVYDALGSMHACAWSHADEWFVEENDDVVKDLPALAYELNATEKTRLLDSGPSTVYQITDASLFVRMIKSALDRDDHQIALTPIDLPRRETFWAIRWAGRLNGVCSTDFTFPGWVIASTSINADERVVVFAHDSSCNF